MNEEKNVNEEKALNEENNMNVEETMSEKSKDSKSRDIFLGKVERITDKIEKIINSKNFPTVFAIITIGGIVIVRTLTDFSETAIKKGYTISAKIPKIADIKISRSSDQSSDEEVSEQCEDESEDSTEQ